MRSSPTDAEARVWRHLRAGRFSGYKFRRQQPIDHFIVDFVCFGRRLIVEVDGGQHAESAEDVVRTRYLESQGFRLSRFWNHDVLQQTDVVLQAILDALERE